MIYNQKPRFAQHLLKRKLIVNVDIFSHQQSRCLSNELFLSRAVLLLLFSVFLFTRKIQLTI